MNQNLYDAALLTLNRVAESITPEIIEMHVEDAVNLEQELSSFATDWSVDMTDVEEALQDYFHVQD